MRPRPNGDRNWIRHGDFVFSREMSARSRRSPVPTDPIKQAALAAARRLLDPLLDLMFDAGVTVQEFNSIVRDRAVRIAGKRVIKDSGRQSKSRVAIMTGLSRSQVTRILRLAESASQFVSDYHPAGRVLAGWHDNPRFLAPSGVPAVLPIFGARTSFEKLVKIYGGGIPVRAMLDELLQLQAVALLADQRVQAMSRVPISTGLTCKSIAAAGERGRDLMHTLAHNARRRTQPLFEATAQIQNVDPEMMAVVRREITEQGINFINAANSLLKRSQRRRNRNSVSAGMQRCGVTIYYFQDGPVAPECEEDRKEPVRRKNLRRKDGQSHAK